MPKDSEVDKLIFGYSWDDIQARQHKKYQPKPVVTTTQSAVSVSDSELQLFREIGVAGLEARGFYGLLDRLRQLGHIEGS